MSTPDEVKAAAGRLLGAARDGTLDSVARRHGVRLLGLFGSAARPGGEPADLDVAVSFLGEPDVLALLDDLVAMTELDTIDLVLVDGAEPLLRAEAFVGIPLFEAEPGLYANEQMAALAERRDTAWLRALDRRALAHGS